MRWVGRTLAIFVLGALGCASTQRVALYCVPHEVQVFVDGRALEPDEQEVDLHTDRPHTLFFKGGEYEPQLVLLQSRESDSGPVLEPADVCSSTAFVPTRPEIRMQVDEPAD